MFFNYLKVAVRHLFKYKVFTIINSLGLASGIAACLLMYLYVTHEQNYDAHHEHAASIVRITSRLTGPETDMAIATSPTPLAATLKKDFPEIANAVRFQPAEPVFKIGEALFNEKNVFFSEPEVFQIFTYTFLEGNAQAALSRPNSVVLTEYLAKKYFKGPVLGKTIICNREQYEVTGVIRDLPTNSDLKINALLSKDFPATEAWLDDFPNFTFALFKSAPSLPVFDKKLDAIAQRYIRAEFEAAKASEWALHFHTELLKDVHYSESKLADTPKGDRSYNYLFSILAVFVLVIALLNYVNLSTARATDRAKEVGMRKVVGAGKKQLVVQFLADAFLLNLFASVIALLMALAAEPFLNGLLGIDLGLSVTTHAPALALVLAASTFLAGLYPAFILSGYDPIKTLKGRFSQAGQGLALRKSITVFQFALASVMLIGTVVVYCQMRFLHDRHPGFEEEQVVTLFLPGQADSLTRRQVEPFAQALKGHSDVAAVSVGSGMHPESEIPRASTLIGGGRGKKRELMSNYIFIDDAFISLLHIQLAQGRNLSQTFATDKQSGFIVNEAFAKMAGWKNPLGQEIEGFGHKGKVVGVAKNFHYRSMHNVIEPVVMIYNTFPASTVTVRIRAASLTTVEQLWKSHFTGYPFNYAFLDDSFDKLYAGDQLRMQIFNYFTILAVVISMLGLYGLISVVTAQKTKEIGVRKVLGATAAGITLMLSGGFVRLAGIALLFAFPVAWYLTDRWLQNFAYHIALQPWMFIAAGALAVTIALMTVGFQSMKAALADPVRSLRNE